MTASANFPAREYVLAEGTRFAVLTPGTDTGGRHDLVEAVQAPGTTTPLHLHTRYDERLWLIEGEVVAWVGEHRFTVGAGRLLTIPMNVPHMIQAGPDGVHALNITSPTAFAELIERTGTPKALAGPDTRVDLERSAPADEAA
jgi:mannose-6-phosphate isomerase-like protein (cupin superfamily)